MSLYNTYIDYVGDGSTTDFPVPFTYLNSADIVVTVGGASASFTLTSPGVVSLSPAPSSGVGVRVARSTNVASPRVVFANGSSTTANQLNTAIQQVLYSQQEAIDRAQSSIGSGAGGFGWDIEGLRLVNVADPTVASDGATKNYVDQAIDNVELLPGATGQQGPKGDKGDQGIQGPKGDTGAQGPEGPQGVQGPEGDQGIQGQSFVPNAEDVFANRATYDAQPKGFAFLATDQGEMYFKNSNTSGDWSAGMPFGQGPTGPAGPVGMTYRGAYSATTAYVQRDVILQQNSCWILTAVSSTGNAPPTLPTTSNAFWGLLALGINVTLGPFATLAAGTSTQYVRGDGTLAALPTYDFTPYMQKANNLSDLASAATARSNLGLGALATIIPPGGTNIFLNGAGAFTTPPVTSVFGRTGAVVAASGDYSFGQISGTITFAQIGSAAVASAAQIRNNTASLIVDTDQAWAAKAPVALPATTGTCTLNMSNGIDFTGTLTGNITMAAPSNLKPGQCGIIEIIAGSFTVSWSSWQVPSSGAPVANTTGSTLFFYWCRDSSTIFVNKIF